LILTNWGTREVQVVVEYYEPPVGLNASAPSINVSVPPDASIFLDGFPQGNYVFCAHWQTDLDTDGDGLKDYDRMVTHGWISSAPNVDIRQTREVYVSSPFSPTPTGRCDGFKGEAPQTETFMSEFDVTDTDPTNWMAAAETPDEDLSGYDASSDDVTTGEVGGEDDSEPSGGADFWDQGDGDDENGDDGDTTQPPDGGGTGTTTGLNSAELANQGTHNYSMTCENNDLSDTRSFTTSWEFTADGVILGGENFYAKMSPGVYQNDYGTIITFYSVGYTAQSFFTETDSDGQTTTTETYCDAVIQ
jgi:hypothetical protein